MSEQIVSKAIEKIIEMDLPCANDNIEVLCDECPFDIVPKVDCGLALIQERASMLKLEREKCPDCGSPATHPSGLCRDCYQAKLETEKSARIGSD